MSWEPKIVVIACNWCTYAAADLAGSFYKALSEDMSLLKNLHFMSFLNNAAFDKVSTQRVQE